MRKRKWFGAALLLCTGILSLQVYGSGQESQLAVLAGRPGIGYQDGLYAEAAFGEPEGIAVKEGMVAVADTANNLIRGAGQGRVSSLAGKLSGRDALGYGWSGYRDGNKDSSCFSSPADCVYFDGWKLAVADRGNHAVRVVDGLRVYTVGGHGTEGYQEAAAGEEALFSGPSGVAADASGNLYVADTGNHCIRMIAADGSTSLVAGTPQQGGFQDGPVASAQFMEPGKLALGEDGTIYVCDTGNQRIRKIRDGQVTTLAGGSQGSYLNTQYRNPGYQDGTGEQAMFRFPQGICLAGNVVIVADTGNHVIRAVSPSGITGTIAGTGDAGFTNGSALAAALQSPTDVAWENGVLYICDGGNSAIRTMNFDPEAWLRSLNVGE